MWLYHVINLQTRSQHSNSLCQNAVNRKMAYNVKIAFNVFSPKTCLQSIAYQRIECQCHNFVHRANGSSPYSKAIRYWFSVIQSLLLLAVVWYMTQQKIRFDNVFCVYRIKSSGMMIHRFWCMRPTKPTKQSTPYSSSHRHTHTHASIPKLIRAWKKWLLIFWYWTTKSHLAHCNPFSSNDCKSKQFYSVSAIPSYVMAEETNSETDMMSVCMHNSHCMNFPISIHRLVDSITRKRSKRKQKKKKRKKNSLECSVRFQAYMSRSAFMCCLMFVFSHFPSDLRSRWNVARRQIPTQWPTQTGMNRDGEQFAMAQIKMSLWISNYRPATSYQANEKHSKSEKKKKTNKKTSFAFHSWDLYSL